MAKYGVIGAGLIGSIFKDLSDFEVVHHDEWQPIRWDGIVNCAAISTRRDAEAVPFCDVLEANVYLPFRMQQMCEFAGIPFVTFSSMAVYAWGDGLITEESPLFPHDPYSASKILMEQALPQDKCFIFRIPRVAIDNGSVTDFGKAVEKWTACENLMQSLIYEDSIIEVVERALTNKNIPCGIYNILSEIVHLPSYVREKYGWRGEIVPKGSLGLSPALELDDRKAKRAKLCFQSYV